MELTPEQEGVLSRLREVRQERDRVIEEMELRIAELTKQRNAVILEAIDANIQRKLIAEAADLGEQMVYTVRREARGSKPAAPGKRGRPRRLRS
ncbi:hypothetical protein [Nocardia carnea]|uniref:hypothetical protein n=1 Tax=Nocardia carnea TaxID=37328 RepID=UPI002457C7CD|nr:hypothetical protein [Nocardia carnea]